MNYLGWQVNGIRYGAKTHALMAAYDLCVKEKLDPSKHIWGKIRFHCYDDSWTNTTESELSFFKLCKIRARQIRQKHSYFRLWYSGGVDSHTALLAFIDTKCLPDEIAICKGSSFGDTEADLEIIDGAIPWLKKNNLFHLVKFYEMDSDFWQKQYNPNNDWLLDKGVNMLQPLSINLLQKYGLVDKGANVMGYEKPLVYKIKNQWHMAFLDSNGDWIGDVPEFEGFYISPDLPELHIKQSHLLCRWVDSQNNGNLAFDDFSNNLIVVTRNRAIGRVDSASPVCEQALWKASAKAGPLSWKQKKLYDIYTKEDKKIIRHYDDVSKYWHEKFNYVMENKTNKYSHFMGIWGPFINLETGKKYTVDQLYPNGFNQHWAMSS